MTLKSSALVLTCTAALALGACTGVSINKKIEKEGQYWQRVNVSETTWLRGMKAQQLLNKDIASCVTELRELERLGMLRNAIPTNMSGRVLDPDELELSKWDTPERDKHLLTEHSDYQDFNGCMLAKGWERIKFIPYDRVEQSRKDYLDAHIDYEYRSKYEKEYVAPHEDSENYENLNQ